MSDIAITIGADWGCDHTDDDGHAYAAFVERWFAARGLRVSSGYNSQRTSDEIDTDKYTEDDVRAMLVECWDDWCGANWPRTTAALPS